MSKVILEVQLIQLRYKRMSDMLWVEGKFLHKGVLDYITQYYSISKSAIQNMRYCRNFTKAGLNLSPCMVATQKSTNSRFCSVVEIKLNIFLKGGLLPRSGFIVIRMRLKQKTTNFGQMLSDGLSFTHMVDSPIIPCFCQSHMV